MTSPISAAQQRDNSRVCIWIGILKYTHWEGKLCTEIELATQKKHTRSQIELRLELEIRCYNQVEYKIN